MHKKGFTLVELMVVIAVIGILAASLFPALGNYYDRARQTDAKSKMRQISQIALDAQIIQGKALRWITNNGCSNCVCRPTAPYFNTEYLPGMSDTNYCYINWENAINIIALASGMDTGSVIKYYRDPWNAPYLLDENEDEHGACDRLTSSFGEKQTTSTGLYTISLQRSSGDTCY